jgi:hypothetical protein
VNRRTIKSSSYNSPQLLPVIIAIPSMRRIAEYVPEGLQTMLAQAPPILGRSGAATAVDDACLANASTNILVSNILAVWLASP